MTSLGAQGTRKCSQPRRELLSLKFMRTFAELAMRKPVTPSQNARLKPPLLVAREEHRLRAC